MRKESLIATSEDPHFTTRVGSPDLGSEPKRPFGESATIKSEVYIADDWEDFVAQSLFPPLEFPRMSAQSSPKSPGSDEEEIRSQVK